MKIKLKNAVVHKYKCIESEQTFDVDDKVTVLVGMNESGKTSILQALAKTRYFESDKNFEFDTTHDYPRKEKKKLDKSGENPLAVVCTYIISDELIKQINDDIGSDLFSVKEISLNTSYDNTATISGVTVDIDKFWKLAFKKHGISDKPTKDMLNLISTSEEFTDKVDELENDDELKEKLEKLTKYFKSDDGWGNPVARYVYFHWIQPSIPKFLYYDEYYALPSRINIESLQAETLDDEQLKTAKALFELADINIDDLLHAENFEDFIAELEATEASITEDLFEYWTTNKSLDIRFKIDTEKGINAQGQPMINGHVLDIRVWNNKAKISLPLKNRSKGFNWFFSFLVWFKKIQESNDTSYVLLLDEPGLNLHASAQADLLRFIEDLTDNYQVIYSTHSPFMVDPSYLNRVRTVHETDNEGSVISDSIQEKDPNTLFPLQAALGYDLAQNLFVSKNNLLVEGVSDLIYLECMSGVLQEKGKIGLREDITIVPVGGLEKVSTFVSLLRGSKLNMVCLLDSAIDPKSKAKLDSLVVQKIINKKKIKYFDEFVDTNSEADIEDLFSKEEYLKLFNQTFSEHDDILLSDLNADIERIILQINKKIGVERFNHYRPSNTLTKLGVDALFFCDETLDKFDKLFTDVNNLF